MVDAAVVADMSDQIENTFSIYKSLLPIKPIK